MSHKKEPEMRDADQMIREYYERDTEGAFGSDATEPVTPAEDRTGTHTARSPLSSGGDVDAAWQQADAGTETVGGSNPTPDQDIVEELGRAVGETYQDSKPLKFGDKVLDRDDRRWELNPASSEDYQARVADQQAGAWDCEPTPPPQPEPSSSKKSGPSRPRRTPASRGQGKKTRPARG